MTLAPVRKGRAVLLSWLLVALVVLLPVAMRLLSVDVALRAALLLSLRPQALRLRVAMRAWRVVRAAAAGRFVSIPAAA